jgi:hypothetical protein
MTNQEIKQLREECEKAIREEVVAFNHYADANRKVKEAQRKYEMAIATLPIPE